MFGIKTELELLFFKARWRKANKNNMTVPMSLFPIRCVQVGNNTYGELNVYSDSCASILHLGNYCSIARNVMFLLNSDHRTDTVSTYPFRVRLMRTERAEAGSRGDIVIEDDVWIGYGATILSGVHIGQGAVIGAGTVVTKDVQAYAVVAGNPAKILRYRFDPDTIGKLLRIDYGKLTRAMIKEHIDDLYRPVGKDLDISWMPIRET